MIPVIIGFAALFLAGCGSDDPPPQLPCLPYPTGNGGHGGTAGTGGHSGTSGTAGHAGGTGTGGHAATSGAGGTAGHAGTSGSAGKGGMMKKVFHLPPGFQPGEIEEVQEESSRTFGLFRLFDSPREVAKVGIGSLSGITETPLPSESSALVCASENGLG